jgi:hypothetical protein
MSLNLFPKTDIYIYIFESMAAILLSFRFCFLFPLYIFVVVAEYTL